MEIPLRAPFFVGSPARQPFWVLTYLGLLGLSWRMRFVLDSGWLQLLLFAYMALAVFVPVTVIPAPQVRRAFRIRGPGWSLALSVSFGAWLVLAAALYLTGWRNEQLLAESTLGLLHRWRFHLLLLGLAAAEELFFRAYLQETVFARYWEERGLFGLTFKNLFAALLFGVAHVLALQSWLGFWHVLTGGFYGWLVERSGGRLAPAIWLHAWANLLSYCFDGSSLPLL